MLYFIDSLSRVNFSSQTLSTNYLKFLHFLWHKQYTFIIKYKPETRHFELLTTVEVDVRRPHTAATQNHTNPDPLLHRSLQHKYRSFPF
jgi:hypothetical protein